MKVEINRPALEELGWLLEQKLLSFVAQIE